METFVRIKRSLDEEPAEAIVLNIKKQKTELSAPISTVFQLAGTVADKASNAVDSLRGLKGKASKRKLEELPGRIRPEVSEPASTSAARGRYKVVKCIQAATQEAGDATAEATKCTIVDLESNSQAADEALKSSNAEKYVYDIYCGRSTEFDDIEADNFISAYPLGYELTHNNSVEDSDISEEDSNDENNYRNDYPDEDSDHSINEDDMINAVNRVDLDGDHDLSSDEEDEKLVFCRDTEGLDPACMEFGDGRYGKLYERFKAREQAKQESCIYFGDIESDSDSEEDNV